MDPQDEDEEEEGLDPELFKGLRGMIPEQDAQELLVEVTGLAKGFKAQSVSAKSRASRMESLMLQACREAAAAKEEAEEDKRLLRSENNLLKRTLGLVTAHQPAIAKSAARSARQASDSRGEDPPMSEADLLQWSAEGETSQKRVVENQAYPMMKTVLTLCWFVGPRFLLFHRRDDLLQSAARGSVNGPPSLHALWGSGNLLSLSSCQEQERFCP